MAAAGRHRRNSNIAVSSKDEQHHVQGREVFALGKKKRFYHRQNRPGKKSFFSNSWQNISQNYFSN